MSHRISPEEAQKILADGVRASDIIGMNLIEIGLGQEEARNLLIAHESQALDIYVRQMEQRGQLENVLYALQGAIALAQETEVGIESIG